MLRLIDLDADNDDPLSAWLRLVGIHRRTGMRDDASMVGDALLEMSLGGAMEQVALFQKGRIERRNALRCSVADAVSAGQAGGMGPT